MTSECSSHPKRWQCGEKGKAPSLVARGGGTFGSVFCWMCLGMQPPALQGSCRLPVFLLPEVPNVPAEGPVAALGDTRGETCSLPNLIRGFKRLALQSHQAWVRLSTLASLPRYRSHFPFCGQGFYLISTLSSSISFSVSLLILATKRKKK